MQKSQYIKGTSFYWKPNLPSEKANVLPVRVVLGREYLAEGF